VFAQESVGHHRVTDDLLEKRVVDGHRRLWHALHLSWLGDTVIAGRRQIDEDDPASSAPSTFRP
jgi:hypothetical protein